MRKLTSSLGVTLASVGAVAGIALSSATPAIAANQALMLNGIGLSIDQGLLPDIVMSEVLGGAFATYQRTGVPWPMQANPVTGKDSMYLADSIVVGVDNLDAAIANALTKIGPGEHVTVVGLSAGALVADEEMRRLLSDPNAPDKSQLTFVVVADSSRATFNQNRFDTVLNYQYRLPAETKYDTVAVVAEYDGFADFPDRVWNIVAVINAYIGEIYKHVPSVFTDLSTIDPSNITTTTNALGGVTTKYFVPAEHLPLVELLPFLAPQEAALRKIVDSAYKRNDVQTAAATPAPAAAVANSTDTATVAVPEAVAAPEAAVPVSVASAPASKDSAPADTVAATQPVKAAEPVSEPTAVTNALDTATQTPAATTNETPQPTGRRAAATRGSDSAGVTRHRTSANPARSAAASRADNSPSA